jgi:hypothetical protein
VRDFFLFFLNLFFIKGHLEKQSLDNVIRKRFPFITPKLYKLEDFIFMLEELSFLELNKNKSSEDIVEITLDFRKDVVQYRNNKIVSPKLQKVIDRLAKLT